MYNTLFDYLSFDDVDKLFELGNEIKRPKEATVIEEGKLLSCLYVVLDGSLGITVSSLGTVRLATLGPGESVGEMAFLEGDIASANVVALEDIWLLQIPVKALWVHLEQDSGFAARFYRALGKLMAKRMRDTTGQFGCVLQDRLIAERSNSPVWRKIAEGVQQFKTQAQQIATHNSGEVPLEWEDEFRRVFTQLTVLLNELIGDASRIDSLSKINIGNWVHQELLPYLFLTTAAQRAYTKPRGFAGDYILLRHISEHSLDTESYLGKLLDQCFYALATTRAIKNRRLLIGQYLYNLVASHGEETVYVGVLGVGSAEEIFDVYARLSSPSRLKVTLIDSDLQALAFIGDQRDKLNLTEQVEIINESLVHLATGRQKYKIANQDFIYSPALADQFSDSFLHQLINYSYHGLKPGGKILIGNFSSGNTSKAWFDYVLDWKINHRTEKDINDVFRQSDFKRTCSEISYEDQGVEMFAECIRSY